MSPASKPIRPDVREALRRYWGYDSLRPLQAEAIEAGLSGRDSLVVLPTGGGKSLCYQVPPLIAARTDLVVSPLISLMKDQVDALRTSGYPAAAIHGGLAVEDRRQIERELANGRLRLVFAAPERLQSGQLIASLKRAGVRAVAVDEAHCISHWGHDFRQDYRRLAGLREALSGASVHAFTATATARVRADIAAQLRLRDPAVLVGSFDRPNLVYRVVPKQDVQKQVLEVVKRHSGEAVIVYCLSRADTEALAAFLQQHRLRAACYHAGLSADLRHRTQDDFAAEKLDVIVATVAFGMGIDRSDVRCVIHASVPKSVEHYQQETGRAGRDGLPAECVLFYSYGDIARWQGLIEKSAAEAGADPAVAQAGRVLLEQMQRYCSRLECRHRQLVAYFGQTYDKSSCSACDICLDEVASRSDATVAAQKVLSCVARVQERYGAGHVVDVLVGARTARVLELGHDRLSTYGLFKGADKAEVRGIIHQLLDQGLLERVGDEYPVLALNAASWEVLRGQRAVRLRQAAASVKPSRAEADSWAGVDRGLFEELRQLRQRIAQRSGVAAYVILHDRALRDLARQRPTTPDGLRAVRGIGQRKHELLGAALLAVIRRYCREHGVGSDVAEATDGLDVQPVRSKPGVEKARANVAAFALFRQGMSVEHVAVRIGRATSTTYDYLEAFIARERPASIAAWVPAEAQARVTEALLQCPSDRLRPIFEHLGRDVPYWQIRIVVQHRARALAGTPAEEESERP